MNEFRRTQEKKKQVPACRPASLVAEKPSSLGMTTLKKQKQNQRRKLRQDAGLKAAATKTNNESTSPPFAAKRKGLIYVGHVTKSHPQIIS